MFGKLKGFIDKVDFVSDKICSAKRNIQLISNFNNPISRFFLKSYFGKMGRKLGISNPGLLFDAVKSGKYASISEYLFKGPYYNKGDIKIYESFKEYIYDENKINNLLKGMDDKSIQTVMGIVKTLKRMFLDDKIKLSEVFSEQEIKDQKDIGSRLINYMKSMGIRLSVPSRFYNQDNVFIYKHGLYEVPKITDIIRSKDVMDCGSFLGDSAIMISKELNVGKVYCFEPNPQNHELLKKSIDMNMLGDKVIPLDCGVNDVNGYGKISVDGGSSKISDDGVQNITLKRIDDIVKGNDINLGLIKMDIEGSEYMALLGAKETISKYKPVLVISIYHNGRDFFEIRSLIDSWNVGYKFMIRKTTSLHPISETVLICY